MLNYSSLHSSLSFSFHFEQSMLKKSYWLIAIVLLFLIGGLIWRTQNINGIGLSLLQKIKKMKGAEVDLSMLNKEETPVITHEIWNGLVAKLVTPKGAVYYKGFIEEKAQLQQYLDVLSAHPPAKNWTEAEQIAYWINAYNAFTVKLIIDNYPLKSIKQIGGGVPMINSPWDIKFFKIGGVDFDLNTIEHGILRKHFEEPRIHFAINCASISCPRLRNEAFTAENLEQQLNDQATYFVNNPIKNKITAKEIALSPIFNWFEGDFIKTRNLLSFVQEYTEVQLQPTMPLVYLDYDWNLNE